MYKRNQKQAVGRHWSKFEEKQKKNYLRVWPAKSTDHRTEIYDYYYRTLALTRIRGDDIPNHHVYKKPETSCRKTKEQI